MSKALKTIAIVAGVVALTFAIPGVGTAIGTAIGVSISAGTAATIAAVASAVSTAASVGAQALQKPPGMQGTVSQILIGMNMPVPYAMGRSYIGGNQVYDKSDTGTENYDRTQVMVYTAAGPIDSFESFQGDFSPMGFSGSDWNVSRVATGFYGEDGGYLWLNTRKGECPDTALSAYPGREPFGSFTSAHKLSGFAAAAVTMEFDEDGVRWASGIPQWGVVAKWVKIYDPRLDSTYPGGSGTQRWATESTWAWSENPALHALTYARGRVINGVKVVGVGLSQAQIDVASYVQLANICVANGWTCGGAVYEAPGISKWDNLKRILAAACAEPVWVGGVLSCKFSSPKTALDTITADDLADSGVEITAMTSWRDRVNTVIPRYRSEANKWEYVQSDAVVGGTYVTEDGETKTKEIQYDLVQRKDQAAELAAYEVVNGREFGPVQLTVKPRFMLYRPGEALLVNIPVAGLTSELCVITARTVDPANGSIQLTLMSETTAKHAFALGRTGTAPPSPTIIDPGDSDTGVGGVRPPTVHQRSSMPDIPVIRVMADHTGTPLTGELPRDIQLVRLLDEIDVSASSIWTILAPANIPVTAAIGETTGILTVTALDADCDFFVRSFRDGFALRRLVTFDLAISEPPSPGGGGGPTATDTSFLDIISATHAAVSGELTVTVGALGKVVLAAPLIARVITGSGTNEVFGIWRHWDTGTSTWVDVGTEVASNPDPSTSGSGLGVLNVSPPVITGLTPAAVEKYQLYGRNASGIRTVTLSGTASAFAS